MSSAEHLPVWAAVPVIFLLVLGGGIALIGAFGLMRLPNFYQRIHGPAITVTLGTGCILIASMIYFSVLQSRLVIHELLITVFVLLTSPVVSMLIMRAAIYRDLRNNRHDLPASLKGVYAPSPEAEKALDAQTGAKAWPPPHPPEG